jgi:hypothetical protein
MTTFHTKHWKQKDCIVSFGARNIHSTNAHTYKAISATSIVDQQMKTSSSRSIAVATSPLQRQKWSYWVYRCTNGKRVSQSHPKNIPDVGLPNTVELQLIRIQVAQDDPNGLLSTVVYKLQNSDIKMQLFG